MAAFVPRLRVLRAGVLAVFLLAGPVAGAAALRLGDLDGDGELTVADVVMVIGHYNRTATLTGEQVLIADVNQDGFVNQTDADVLAQVITGAETLPALPLARVGSTTPVSGEGGVAVTRETVLRFTFPLASTAIVPSPSFFAEAAGRRLVTRVELSNDRKSATLFYQENIPAGARVRVSFDGNGLRDFLGRPLDPDGDGVEGGVATMEFETAGVTANSGTGVIGRVFRSDPLPGSLNPTNVLETPLQGVIVSVIGAEETLRATTDAMGNFQLRPCPSGRFFVRVDGRTATGSRWPDGDYFPLIEKAWEAVAGRLDNLAGGTGTIYLPIIRQGTLQPVDPVKETVITFTGEVVDKNPELAGVSIAVPANSLVSANGTRGGMVGIAPVSANRLPEPLPPGLNHVLDITIQTDGPGNFDRPVPARFPNLPDPVTGERLPPGAKTALWSFNHDSGRWEIAGPMTVTADGLFVETDPGVGILQPGWHGTQPGSEGTGGPILGGDDDDIDGDGIPNGSDDDIDGDGRPNGDDDDVDGDGAPNGSDDDVDGDGRPNGDDDDVDGDGAPNGGDGDVDGDGIPNGSDGDIDGDGIPNEADGDADGDGSPNGEDRDVDGDGVENGRDQDVDGDGTPNDLDPDTDGDGIPNESDDDEEESCVGPTVEIVSGAGGAVCQNEIVVFTAVGNPGGGTYTWSGGEAISGASSSIYRARFLVPGLQPVTVTYSCSSENATATANLVVNESSGVQWVNRFRIYSSLDELSGTFRLSCERFVAAINNATNPAGQKARADVRETYRTKERAYLMHWSGRIAQGTSPDRADTLETVPICWLHRDENGNPDYAESQRAAIAMTNAFHIVYPAAYPWSLHTQRQAVDMSISWEGELHIFDAQNKLQVIKSLPRSGANAELQAIGRGFGVIKKIDDPPHWSATGN